MSQLVTKHQATEDFRDHDHFTFHLSHDENLKNWEKNWKKKYFGKVHRDPAKH